MNIKKCVQCAVILLIAVSLTGCVSVNTTERTYSSDDAQVQKNKEFAIAFYQRVLLDGDVDAADLFLSPGYIQHNPNIPTGLAGFKGYFKDLGKRLEQAKTQLHGNIDHVVGEGDMVVLFVSYQIEGMINFKFQAADLFRLEDGLIAEHWDVLQGATLRDHTLLMQN